MLEIGTRVMIGDVPARVVGSVWSPRKNIREDEPEEIWILCREAPVPVRVRQDRCVVIADGDTLAPEEPP